MDPVTWLGEIKKAQYYFSQEEWDHASHIVLYPFFYLIYH